MTPSFPESQEEELDAAISVGDRARRRDFEVLVDVATNNQPLGAIKAAQLVPWVPPFLTKFLIVLVDPRRQSSDLRQTLQYLTSTLPQELQTQFIAISPDDPSDTVAWLKRVELKTDIHLFVDSSMDWMTKYQVVGEGRYSMSVLVFDDDGILRKHEHTVEASNANQVVASMMQLIDSDSSTSNRSIS